MTIKQILDLIGESNYEIATLRTEVNELKASIGKIEHFLNQKYIEEEE